MIIDTFHHHDGWRFTDKVIPDEWDNLDKLLTDQLGYVEFECLGTPDNGIKIYIRYRTFLVSMDTISACQLVYCDDFPSLLGLLAQLEPWFRMSQATEVNEYVRDLHDLLTTYGEEGPLEECLHRRRRAEANARQLRLRTKEVTK